MNNYEYSKGKVSDKNNIGSSKQVRELGTKHLDTKGKSNNQASKIASTRANVTSTEALPTQRPSISISVPNDQMSNVHPFKAVQKAVKKSLENLPDNPDLALLITHALNNV